MRKDELLNKIILFVQDINKKYPLELSYLFGSIAKGEDNNMSDIDIAIKFENTYMSLNDALIRGEIIDLGQAIFNMQMDIVNLDRASIFLKHQVVKYGIVIMDYPDRASFESLVFREYFDFKYYSDIYDDNIVQRLKNKTYFAG